QLLVSAMAVAPLAVFSTGQSAQVAWLGGPGLVQWLQIAAVVALGVGCAALHGPAPRRGAPWRTGPVTAARLGLPLLVVPTALLLAAGAYKPMYLDRYVLYSYLGLGLLMGRALDALFAQTRGRAWRRRGAWCGVVLAVLALVPVTLEMRTPDSRKDDVTAVSHAVRRLAPGADGVLFMPSRRREWRMSYPGPYLGLRDLALRRDAVRSHTLEGEEEPAPVVRERVLAARRVVALTDPRGQPLDTTATEVVKREVLRRHFVLCDRIRVKGAQVVLYAHRGDCPAQPDRGSRAGRR
ncbi:hypothetical protein JFN87_13815, partial [Streptomyces bomunensis]|nr:hypothetical protein [Streptomyces montanisoli]